MKFSMKVSEWRDYLNKLDKNYDDYDVVYFNTSDDSKYSITKIKINNKNEEIQLTNNNKYKLYER